MQFKKMYDTNTLSPDMAKTPLCMEQYQFMFSTRIPAMKEDTTVLSTGDYCIVMRNNIFWKLNISGDDIQTQKAIDWIYNHSNDIIPSVGVLTSENRDSWTTARDILMLNPENTASLAIIENGLYVICLDTEAPVTTEQKSREYWHGTSRNRFFDKSLQFIYNDNGKMGFCGEHSYILLI